MKILKIRGVTLLELLVVLGIVSILSTIAVGVYSNHITRARFAKARAEIRMLETAVTQYQLDTGAFPPSGSGTTIAPDALSPVAPLYGSGYLQVALRSSLNGDFRNPLNARWQGPYVNWDYNRLGFVDGAGNVTPISLNSSSSGAPGVALGMISFLDPWGSPYTYINEVDYGPGVGAELPVDHPFFATETYYNPSTFQIISNGPNMITNAGSEIGKDGDDVSNFIGSNF